ncbi:MAG: hypothetical protein ABIP27_17425 [Flavobacterium circumlabens]|uniref:hypothetical protein n=1 Tax=Flavobacterium circumlabens TaxID=2133765 RepID=UPI00326426A3
MKALTEFKNLMHEKMQQKVPIQTEWVKVSSVDWEDKTMVAIGEDNGLEYFDVVLGLGSINIRPKVESLALVGSIHNGEACFMISCEEIEEIELIDKTGFKVSLNDGLLLLNGDQFGGIVNAKELKTQVDKNTEILNKIQSVFKSWVPTPNDGGASLKTLVTEFVNLPLTDLGNIQNDKIKHGNG